ncbi:leucine carboxyl methyltransferase 2 [Macroventuria anomochaeta]|uniref:Leucine carboxyl methyltransferase 2 n=1 Tax=Macroventuria anomochaeta TaxID=301207 RepID=A0ACB6SCE4_9PLEO|nr:leucine carboxyl methyltransferase 2 [Macroventuria anomochaeta]KAF2631182.1 leucine carboxyl methyltransferase 2 [Macroventuria anomochaeta]
MSAKPKAKPAKGAVKGKGHLRSKAEKRDDDIIHTNDSSIVSKRCVSKLYLSEEPDFYEPFAPKYVRRNPLINRGYWLRMHAIEQVIKRFLEEDDGRKKVVVNLGCGYDPLPFQFWHRYASLTEEATFVDVDYPQLIEKKKDVVFTKSLLRDALLKTGLRTAEAPVRVRSDKYMAIGCDLRDLQLLERTLRAELDIPSTSLLFVAEVSVTYMPLTDANKLIQWANTFEASRFCVLEQYLPQGPDHPFALTMLTHFDKLHASINSVKQYQTLAQQSSRFLDAGWPSLEVARNLWDLWSDDSFTPPSLRKKVDAIEPFDEWEEFALFGGHYFLLVASNIKAGAAAPPEFNANPKDARNDSSSEPTSISLQSWKLPLDSAWTPRRFTAAFTLDGDTVAVHGGQGPQNRLSSISALTRGNADYQVQAESKLQPSARMCHTVTSMNKTSTLLVGGRASPTQALADCWLMNQGKWSVVDDIPSPRYRHSAVSVNASYDMSQSAGILVFGGKSSDGAVLNDWFLWTSNNGWHSIPVDGPRPPARFGAAISAMGVAQSAQTRGLLIGGIGACGTVLDDVWEWSLSGTAPPRLNFRDMTNRVRSSSTDSTYARIGASLVPWGDALLLIGGVSKLGVVGLAEEFMLLTHSDAGIGIQHPRIHLPTYWPLLVGAGISAVSRNEIVVAGGGAVCFSMGSFWNDYYFTITPSETVETKPWRPLTPQADSTAPAKSNSTQRDNHKVQPKKGKKVTKGLKSKDVPRVQLHNSEDFAALVATSRPAVITGLEIGPCTSLWTLSYLESKLGSDRELVVHECTSSAMTFGTKNFTYEKRSVSSFFASIRSGAPSYLRAISSTQPNKLPTRLEDDFPAISADFQIPSLCREVINDATYHSSPLRISGPVSLWLHYDVHPNILSQISGSKTLTLYPPSDVAHLAYPPGASSSSLPLTSLTHNPKLHPHIAALVPGDVLFIPPMWSHTATPNQSVSIAVNVFWKGLGDEMYAAGRDVYGNRDLKGYENGRRDVEKIVRAFRGLPADVGEFYLQRLAAEILEKGRKQSEKAGGGKEGKERVERGA